MCDGSKDEFITKAEFLEQVVKEGLSKNEARKLLKRFIQAGKIERMPDGKTLKIKACAGCGDCKCDQGGCGGGCGCGGH